LGLHHWGCSRWGCFMGIKFAGQRVLRLSSIPPAHPSDHLALESMRKLGKEPLMT
jgi:hypothetical protein